MNKRVIRHNQKSKKMAGITKEDVACLEGYWSLEEQLGIRQKPTDDLLQHIPQITRNKPGEKRG